LRRSPWDSHLLRCKRRRAIIVTMGPLNSPQDICRDRLEARGSLHLVTDKPHQEAPRPSRRVTGCGRAARGDPAPRM